LGRLPRRPAIGEPQRRVGTDDLEGSRAAMSVVSDEAPDAFEPGELPIDLDRAAPAEERAALAVAIAEPPGPSPIAEAPFVPAFAADARPRGHEVARPAPRPFQPAARPPVARPPVASPANPRVEGEEASIERAATAPQLRRFIKSRAYVPMHELRRRFGINGGDDEVTPVDLERTRVFVGLPEREGRLLGELLRAGDIGYELSLDPITPIVVGVYPMRPVTRG
jgi:hypothetical protein